MCCGVMPQQISTEFLMCSIEDIFKKVHIYYIHYLFPTDFFVSFLLKNVDLQLIGMHI